MKIERQWAMPNKWTFRIKPIKELLMQEITDGLWVDPYAGECSPATITNDLNPERPTDYHLQAIRPARKIAVYRTGDVVRVEVEGAGRGDIPAAVKAAKERDTEDAE